MTMHMQLSHTLSAYNQIQTGILNKMSLGHIHQSNKSWLVNRCNLPVKLATLKHTPVIVVEPGLSNTCVSCLGLRILLFFYVNLLNNNNIVQMIDKK